MLIQPLDGRRLFAVNLDSGFGTEGFATLDGALDTREFAEGGFHIHVLPDDRIYGVGQVDGAGGRGIIGLARWTANGTLDNTFSGDGVVTTDIPAGDANDHSVPHDLAVQGDGKVVVLATTLLGESSAGPWTYELALLRYQPNGALDNTFGTGGIIRIATPQTVSNAGVRVLANGDIALAGTISLGGRVDPVFGRFNSDGSPDTGLSAMGLTTYNSTGQWNTLDDIAVGPGGETYVLTTVGEGEGIIRFTDTGARDHTFVPDAGLPFDPHVGHGAVDVEVQDDGKVLVSGSRPVNALPHALLARLNPTGALDTSFADSGVRAVNLERFDRTWIMPDGEMIARGGAGNDQVFYRFDADGSVSDPYWATGVRTHSDTGSWDVGVQSSGRIVLGGAMDPDGSDADLPLGVARLTDKPAPFGTGNSEALVLPSTDGHDVVTVTVGATTITVTLNGSPLEFARGSYTRVVFDGGEGDDTLTYTGALRLDAFGGGGDDSIAGGFGGNYLSGGDGADTIVGTPAGDTIYGGGGEDSIASGAGDDWVLAGDDNDTIDGGDDDDAIEGGAGDDSVVGGAGGDWVRGDTGGDVIAGGDGQDQLSGNDGQDTLVGEGGNDHLYGGDGADLLHGGAGSDRMDGGAGDDRLYGGDGNDFLQGFGGDDRLVGHGGVDKLYGDGGNDTMEGGDGPDFLWGHGGDDSLDGGGGTDRLFAHDGADTLRGGHGNDHMDGGAGRDLLTGYAGNDSFVANDGEADSVFGGRGNDEAMLDDLLDETESIEPMIAVG